MLWSCFSVEKPVWLFSGDLEALFFLWNIAAKAFRIKAAKAVEMRVVGHPHINVLHGSIFYSSNFLLGYESLIKYVPFASLMGLFSQGLNSGENMKHITVVFDWCYPLNLARLFSTVTSTENLWRLSLVMHKIFLLRGINASWNVTNLQQKEIRMQHL